MNDYPLEIEIDTDTGDILAISDCGSTISIEIWPEDCEVMKEEIRLTKAQAQLLIKVLQNMT